MPAATGAEPPPPPPNPANAEAIIGNIPIAIIPAIGSTPATNPGSTNGSGSSSPPPPRPGADSTRGATTPPGTGSPGAP
ncbi:hypothetical protein [Nocardia abscessus]|uniref:hypothetical protein n=1 Tax=Nocardia abscessus TaxID=120957 RepID=UPI00245829D4|nr:hypothetical protein [Nocardia abscessus]